jgi:hypothetical protein
MHPKDPQSLNRYAYVRDNPTSNIDPTGRDCIYISGFVEFDFGMGDDPEGTCHDAGGTYQLPPNSSNTVADISQPPTVMDDWDFLTFWESGQLPSSINYGPNDGATIRLVNSATFQSVVTQYREMGCPGSANSPATVPGGSGHFEPWLDGYSSPFSGSPNWTLMQVGGFQVNGWTAGSTTTFKIVNGADNSSFTGQSTWGPMLNNLPGVHVDPHGNNDPHGSTGPKHNVLQTFTTTAEGICSTGGGDAF